MSKKEKVLEYLKKYNNITQLEALRMWWDWRLSASIYLLRKDGYKIKSEDITVKKADGTDASVTKYTLLDEMIEQNMNHIPRLD